MFKEILIYTKSNYIIQMRIEPISVQSAMERLIVFATSN